MKKKIIIVVVIILLVLITVTNIVYNNDTNKYVDTKYECCDTMGGHRQFAAPCTCEPTKNIIKKTLLVLGVI